MKTRIFLVLAFAFLFLKHSEAQDVKFGKVSKEDLIMKECPYDQEADAEYLYHSSRVEFEYNSVKGRFDLVYQIHERIKIYNQNGSDVANFSIPYYVGRAKIDNESIFQLKGITYNLEGGKIKETKLNKKSIFDEKSSDYYNAMKFAMPAVKAGSIIDVKYTLRSPRSLSMEEFYFQREIPIRKAKYESCIPEYYVYTPSFKGLLELKKSNTTQKESFSYAEKESNLDKVSRNSNQTSPKARNRSNDVRLIDYNVRVTTYEIENVVSLKNLPYVYSMDNYRSSIRQELASTQFPGGVVRDHAITWNDVAKKLMSYDDFGGILSRNFSSMKSLVKEAKSLPEKEKVAKIYGHFQDKFRWNGLYSLYAGKGMNDCVKTGVGTSGQINLLLVNTLRKAGVEAYPFVYRARSFGNITAGRPTLDGLNYVIALIQFEDGILYLDATGTALTAGMLPSHALNIQGVIIDKEKGLEMLISNPNKGDMTNYYTLAVDENGLSGSFQKRIKGYAAYKTRIKHKKEDEYLSALSSDLFSVENAEVKDFYSNKNSLAVSGDVVLTSGSKTLDDKIIVDVNLLDPDFQNPFTAPSRDLSIFYDSKLKVNNVIKIAIPEGYTVESLPEKLSIASPEKQIQYLIEAKVQGAEVILNIRETMNTSIVNPEYYESVKQFYDQVQAKFQEKIVFTKE